MTRLDREVFVAGPDVLPNRRDVAPHQEFRQLAVPVGDRFHHARVLEKRPTGPARDDALAGAKDPQKSVILDAKEIDQKPVAGDGGDEHVEVRIRRRLQDVGAARIVQHGRMRCKQSTQPVDVVGRRTRRGFPGRKPFQYLADGEELAHPVGREHDHPDTLAWGAGHELPLLQATYRLAQGSAAHSVALGELRFAELGSRRQVAGDDRPAQPVEETVREEPIVFVGQDFGIVDRQGLLCVRIGPMPFRVRQRKAFGRSATCFGAVPRSGPSGATGIGVDVGCAT